MMYLVQATILALTMTWTIASKSSVTPEGDFPAGMNAEYSCSYQKGTVREGDEAVLTLSNLGGITVEKVDISMRSNKTAGAGVITLTMNQQKEKEFSGTFRDWTGAYDNTDYHLLTLFEGQRTNVSEMAITVEGIANSLYIEKYVISYQPAKAYTVMLMAGNQVQATLTEPSGGAGIVLPEVDDYGSWQFVGWSRQEFWLKTWTPEYTPAGTWFYPQEDLTLWAVWRYSENGDTGYQTELNSGEYLYANRDAQIAMAGFPSAEPMLPEPINVKSPNQIYYIDFRDNLTAVIQHAESGNYIGYNGIALAQNNNPWLVYHAGDTTLFYIEQSGKKYSLWLNVWVSFSEPEYTGLQQTGSLNNSPMGLLLPQTGDKEPTYSCHPEAEDNALTPALDNETIVPFGVYEIHVRNGEKQVLLRN